MATTKAINANRVKNNGATVLYGGNVPSGATRVTNVLGIETVGYSGAKNSVTVPDDPDYGTLKADSNGSFGKMTVGKYVAMKQTTELAGVAKDFLLYGGNAPIIKSIYKVEEMRTSHLHTITIASDSEGGASYTFTYSNKNLGFNEDNAARPTRAVPGELTYQKGSNTPINDDYKARTG